MNNLYKNSLYIITLTFIALFALFPSYGKLNPDFFIYILFLIQILGLIFLPEERKIFFKDIKNILFRDKIFFILIILNILMYFSMLVAVNKRTSLSHSIRFSMYLFIFYLICYKFNTKQIKKITITFLSASIIVSLIALYQVLYINILGNNIDMDHRIASTLENPNNLGAYSILIIFAFIMIIFNSKNRTLKFLSSIASLLLLFNIVVSQSRNALLALVAGVIIITLFYNKRYVILSIIFPLILVIIPQTRMRLIDIFDMSQNSSRIKIWQITEIMIKNKNILFGIGYENYSIEYPRYVESNMTYFVRESLKPLHPHNALLKFQVELGIFGALLFLLFIVVSIWCFYKYSISHINNKSTNIYLGLLVGFVCFQIMNIIDCYYGPIKIMYTFFIVLAILNNKVLQTKKY